MELRGQDTHHLFQTRFASVVMDEAHLTTAAHYVPMNRARAQLVSRPEAWPWSRSGCSAAHSPEAAQPRPGTQVGSRARGSVGLGIAPLVAG